MSKIFIDEQNVLHINDKTFEMETTEEGLQYYILDVGVTAKEMFYIAQLTGQRSSIDYVLDKCFELNKQAPHWKRSISVLGVQFTKVFDEINAELHNAYNELLKQLDVTMDDVAKNNCDVCINLKESKLTIIKFKEEK